MSKNIDEKYNELIQKGKQLRWKNRFEKSIDIFTEAIEQDPNFWEGYYQRYLLNSQKRYLFKTLIKGHTYFEQERTSKALEDIEKSLKTSPTEYTKCIIYGFKYECLNDIEKAIEYYQKGIDIEPKNYFAQFKMGNINNLKKDYSKAIEYYLYSIELGVENPHVAYYNIGLCYFNMEKDDLALEYLEKSLEIAPNFLSSIYTKAQILQKKNQFEKSILLYSQTIAINPFWINRYELILLMNSYWARGFTCIFNIIIIDFMQLKNKEEGVKDFYKLKKLDPCFSISYIIISDYKLEKKQPLEAIFTLTKGIKYCKNKNHLELLVEMKHRIIDGLSVDQKTKLTSKDLDNCYLKTDFFDLFYSIKFKESIYSIYKKNNFIDLFFD
jgi:tetratricopeptide (TPR) repeat protein